jgi:hypothetical protein
LLDIPTNQSLAATAPTVSPAQASATVPALTTVAAATDNSARTAMSASVSTNQLPDVDSIISPDFTKPGRLTPAELYRLLANGDEPPAALQDINSMPKYLSELGKEPVDPLHTTLTKFVNKCDTGKRWS